MHNIGFKHKDTKYSVECKTKFTYLITPHKSSKIDTFDGTLY